MQRGWFVLILRCQSSSRVEPTWSSKNYKRLSEKETLFSMIPTTQSLRDSHNFPSLCISAFLASPQNSKGISQMRLLFGEKRCPLGETGTPADFFEWRTKLSQIAIQTQAFAANARTCLCIPVSCLVPRSNQSLRQTSATSFPTTRTPDDGGSGQKKPIAAPD